MLPSTIAARRCRKRWLRKYSLCSILRARSESLMSDEVMDARCLPFQDEFDLVVSFNALHWVPEQDAALTSIHSALISGGKAQIRLVAAGARKSLENVVEETRRTSEWSAYFRDFHDPYLHLTSDEYAAM